MISTGHGDDVRKYGRHFGLRAKVNFAWGRSAGRSDKNGLHTRTKFVIKSFFRSVNIIVCFFPRLRLKVGGWQRKSKGLTSRFDYNSFPLLDQSGSKQEIWLGFVRYTANIARTSRPQREWGWGRRAVRRLFFHFSPMRSSRCREGAPLQMLLGWMA